MQNNATDKFPSSSSNNPTSVSANTEPSNKLVQEPNGTQEVPSQTSTVNQKSLTAEQDFNEAIIKLLVLLYQIDAKVTLTEQDYFDEIIQGLNWHSGVSVSAFVTDAIHQARVAIDQRQSREFLFSLASALQYDPAQALEYAMDITEVDGKRSEDEVELLAILSNRILAKGLVE